MKLFVGRLVAFHAKQAIDGQEEFPAEVEKIWGDPEVGINKCATVALVVALPPLWRQAVPVFPSREAAASLFGITDCAYLLS